MYLSLNEIDVSVKRAARGVGMSWGLAEEAGKAARWLAARRLTRLELVIDYLCSQDHRPYEDMRPRRNGAVWSSRGGRLCPIVAGASFSDGARSANVRAGVRLASLACPALLLPFLASASKALGSPLSVGWGQTAIVVSGSGVEIAAEPQGLADAFAAAVTIALAPRTPMAGSFIERFEGMDVDDEAAARLQALAFRTFVPPSLRSRLTGAGSGLTDND